MVNKGYRLYKDNEALVHILASYRHMDRKHTHTDTHTFHARKRN